MAVVGGKVSGNLEILDFDEPVLFEPWRELVGEVCPGLVERLVQTQTPSGGFHLFYQCEDVEGNQKLAQAVREDGRPTTLIETRGEGGYAIVPPSPAACHEDGRPYVLLRGNLAQVSTISPEERGVLHTAARSFNEYVKPNLVVQGEVRGDSQSQQAGLRPGDDYNNRADWSTLLEAYGWQQMSQWGEVIRWQRPGKAGEGISATTNYAGTNYLYVFSSNATPFEPGAAYTMFAAYVLLEHGGDFKAAAQALARQGYGEHSTVLPPVADSGASVGEFSSIQSLIISERADAPLAPILARARLSDAGNAECLAELAKGRLLYCHTRKKWFVWNRVRWCLDTVGGAKLVAVAVARERQKAAMEMTDYDARRRLLTWSLSSENTQKIEATLKVATILPSIAGNIEQFDQNQYLATTDNGTLDLREAMFRPSRPEDYLTMQLGTTFDSEAAAPRWEQFLSEVFNSDEEMISYIQRAVGYSLTGDTREQVMFLCHGGGANGKSVFLEVLSQLLGDYAATASFETFDAGRRSESSNDLAALKGRRLVTVIETDDDRRFAEAKVKSVTGQDAITCRFLYGEYFTYRPQFKIWMAMNHMPVIKGTDRGIWRRIHLISFTQSFEGRADARLGEKLRTELPGILNWAVEGLREWQRDGLGMPQAVREATENYRCESDSIGQWQEECTISNPTAELKASEAYKHYSEWAQERNERPFGQKSWGRSLIERGLKKERRNSGFVYLGLKLTNSWESTAV